MNETVYRPWGHFTVLERGEGYLIKTITVEPRQRLSVQSHRHREEHWVILKGKASVLKGESEIILAKGHSIDILQNEIHSLQNPSDETLVILEVQKGDILSEDDIIRYKDIYGRV